MRTKRLITPTEESKAYLREAIKRSKDHESTYKFYHRLAEKALKRCDYAEVQRIVAIAAAHRASYYATEEIVRKWRLPDSVHYVVPVDGSLPSQSKRRTLCGSRAAKAVTCAAEGVTCSACLRLLLIEVDNARLHRPKP